MESQLKNYKTEDFDFYLPPELIAQHPTEKRDEAKLLVLDRDNHSLEDKTFKNLPDFLNKGDLLVFNNTKVIPARIFGRRKTGANIEFLLLKELRPNVWQCLVRPARRVKIGEIITFSPSFRAKILSDEGMGLKTIEFEPVNNFKEELAKIGQMPLPPYIKEKLEDQNQYQTIYAKFDGSAAAPTAGLHFTPRLLTELKNKGIDQSFITLHVGLGTFRPVEVENIADHKMHSEEVFISPKVIDQIKKTKAQGKKVYAVGTTAVRALESAAQLNFKERHYNTDIFITPGYDFKVVDGLITNFHLPKSTLLMLVSAFYNREEILNAYQHAIDERYRFFSFGDAMLIK